MPKITLRNTFHDTSVSAMVSEAVARAEQPMIELACEAEGGDKSAARALKRIEAKLCGIVECQCSGQIAKAPSRGPKIRGTGKRVIISATVAPETAAKLRELAAAAGNMGRALDGLLSPA